MKKAREVPVIDDLSGHVAFLTGGGRMGDRIRAFDWRATPLGAPERWPISLQTLMGVLLAAEQPMFVAWGPERLLLYNDSYAPLLGGKEPDALGRPFFSVWSEVVTELTPLFEQVWAGEPIHMADLELMLDRGDGLKEAHFAFSYTPVREADGRVVGLFCPCNETTEQVAAERRVEAERVRQQLLLQQMPGFVAVLHGPGNVFQYVNDAYLAIAGNRDFFGRGIREVFPELEDQPYLDLTEQVYRTGEPFIGTSLPIRLASPAEPRYMDLINQPIRDDAGQVIGVFVGGYDVTERVRAETALRKLNEELEARVEERTVALMRTEEALRQAQKMEAVGQLTGGLAHDFNNLLAGISGSLELIRIRAAQGRIADVERYLVAAEGAARRAAALTQRLLAFSRRQTLDPRPTDVNKLVFGIEELVRRTVGPDIAVEVVGAGGLWTTLIDAPQLDNAILNLCINARDAMPDGGKLTIETANKWLDDRAATERDLPPGQYVSLCITDTGTGMTSDVISRAFDPFFTTKPIGEGTGLGLSMIYGFVRQSGGQVRIYSEIGQGTTMCLYLPRHVGDADPDTASSRPGIEEAAVAGETVLIVDDEPTIRLLVADILSEAGYRVIEGEDGPAGLRALAASPRVDLLITDVGLPGGMNGRQVADAARASRPGLEVLFITGYAENAVLNHGHLERGMHVLTKPFAVEALVRRVREIVAG